MGIKDLLYKTPEMTEERLLELIADNYSFLKTDLIKRLKSLHSSEIQKAILDEWDKIQLKESYLTKSQRDQVSTLVSYCLILMTKNGRTDESTNSN